MHELVIKLFRQTFSNHRRNFWASSKTAVTDGVIHIGKLLARSSAPEKNSDIPARQPARTSDQPPVAMAQLSPFVFLHSSHNRPIAIM